MVYNLMCSHILCEKITVELNDLFATYIVTSVCVVRFDLKSIFLENLKYTV